MEMAVSDNIWIPRSEAEKAAIREQMEQIVAHPAFKSSTHCVKFFRYVVQSALQSECDHIKERTIGIEVFGRDADYDVTQDRVVRSAAAEVRNRIARYYYEPGHDKEIRIDLRPGTYIPEFHLPAEMLAPAEKAGSASPALQAVAPNSPVRQTRTWLLLLGGAVLAVAVVLIGMRTRLTGLVTHARLTVNQPSSIDLFWEPIFDFPGRLLLCADASSPQPSSVHRDAGSIPLASASALVRLAGFMSLRGKSPELRDANSVTFQDLSAEPMVLFGGLDIPWVIEDVKPLRYHPQSQPGSKLIWLEDRNNPSSRAWSIDTALPDSRRNKDYAIVIRIVGKSSGHPRLTIAGLTANSTIGASDCLQMSLCVDDIVRHAPKDWSSKNIEVVLAIHMIAGQPGQINVLAVETGDPVPPLQPLSQNR
jgi:hypothetical protein